ncbi:MAG: BamA/TamA family outer membrane protein [Melioribacteraceae bacterium]|nr:BamA/TamA family outer membrane protein [Melioribacteraceae bacterium]MCF8264875.1 BamA/TamA family outer membrane protein [Melioribacteraceae bacterium]MCF8412993.1 BamA/TamA family outer membrane protein [Melioribacteraceae bacterium]MCF8431346.1 BamA/TamA family outer membrane protein [Melioribacteraceae bacterium]
MINLKIVKYIKCLIFYLILLAGNQISGQVINYELVSINFAGNDVLSDAELERVIISKESPSWVFQFLYSFTAIGGEATYFDSLLIADDINNLQNYYKDNGFFKSEIKASFNLNDEDEEAELTFNINEGKFAVIGNFDLQNIGLVPNPLKPALVENFDVDEDQRYSSADLERMVNQGVRFLEDNGFMLASISEPIVIVDTLKNVVDIEIEFELGNQYKIDNVTVEKTGEGKTLVDDELLKQIVNIKPGEFYRNYNLQRGQVRLYRTNLFNSALVTGVVADTSGNSVPLRISTDIGLMHEVSPEVIVNNEDNSFNLGFGIGFTKKNFLGGARKFSANTSVAAQNIPELITSQLSDTSTFGYADFRLKMEQPFLFNRPINNSIETYVTIQKRRNEWNATLIGAILNTEFELPAYTYFNSLSIFLKWERSKFVYSDSYLYNSFFTALNSQGGLTVPEVDSIASLFTSNFNNTVVSNNAVVGFQFGANKTNNFLFPTSGYYLSFLVEEGNSLAYFLSKALGSEYSQPQYLKTLITGAIFSPLNNVQTSSFGIKFRTGKIFTYRGDNSKLPLNQRFYAGGSNSVRGWLARDLVPKDPSFDFEASSEDLDAVLLRGIIPGGFFILEGSFEARIRLFGNFGSAIFIDYGNSWNDYSELRFEDIAVAFGFGLRYYSDFFPIRFDFGIKAYDPNDTRSIFNKNFWNNFTFHLGIGEAF